MGSRGWRFPRWQTLQDGNTLWLLGVKLLQSPHVWVPGLRVLHELVHPRLKSESSCGRLCLCMRRGGLTSPGLVGSHLWNRGKLVFGEGEIALLFPNSLFILNHTFSSKLAALHRAGDGACYVSNRPGPHRRVGAPLAGQVWGARALGLCGHGRPRRGRKRRGNPGSRPQRVGGLRDGGAGSPRGPGRRPEPAPAAGPKAARRPLSAHFFISHLSALL